MTALFLSDMSFLALGKGFGRRFPRFMSSFAQLSTNIVRISCFQLTHGLEGPLTTHLHMKMLLLQHMKSQCQPRYPPGSFSPWDEQTRVGNIVLHLFQNSHCIFQELHPLFSSCPQDPAAPGTVTDSGEVSRGSALAAGAVTTLGICPPTHQQLLLARSVTCLLVPAIPWAAPTGSSRCLLP